MKVSVTNEHIADKPISPLLCGNFIEYGYGVQTEPMCGEMLFNRSFEVIPPYTYQNKCWFNIYTSEDFHYPERREKTIITDWRIKDWYHAGYEHNAWFAAPAFTFPTLITNESDYLVKETPYRKMSLRYEKGGVHGKTHLIITSYEDELPCGLAQRGKYLKKGISYRFSGYFKRISGDGRIRIALVPEGKWEEPVIEKSFTVESNVFSTLSFEAVSDYTGWCTFVIWLEKSGDIACDSFSLWNGDTISYWRRDVIEKVRDELKPSVIRWPGGCFASFYNFRYGIGKRENRKPVPSYYWGGLCDNDAGSAEFATFCKAVGAESMVCINMFHPKKADYNECVSDFYREEFHNYEFTDEEKGLIHTREWVEYLNGSVDTEYGKKRSEDGYPEPFNIKFFELENEVYRWFEPIEYAKACVRYADAIHSGDPTAKVGIVSYHIMGEKLEEMLEICGEHIDFLSDRTAEEDNLSRQLSIMREFNKEHNKDLFYINPEWLPYVHGKNPDAFNQTNNNASSWYSKWLTCMGIFQTLMMWQRAGGDVKYVCYNNLANTHAQNTIDTPPDKVYLSAPGMAMGFMANSKASVPLALDGYEPGLDKNLQAQAALATDGKSLVLYGLNYSDKTDEITFDAKAVGSFNKAKVRMISALTFNSMNKQTRDEVSVEEYTSICLNNEYTMTLPPLSFMEVTLEQK